jgi:cytosine/adenosine deaminase-related metal-dependent hydrolase
LSNSSSEELQSVFARLLRAELSTCHVVRSATETQNVGRCYEAAVRLLGPAEAFYLSTSGAARALGKSDTIGPVKVGRDADLMLGDLIRIHPLNEDALFELPADDVVALRIYRDRPAATEASCAQGSCVFEQGPHHD